ncbi:sulfite exporter TauE/SafE family protein [Thalassobacillus sp. CUG 92003]|uniref:sulfite exporter TauE/SafE family protein n=1 Tax=Thalassobacillus sp. CUG 92003 TaxID=2736641 RepID=UPI001C638B84|nr:sulfite exporter TauE/SafE family protein [Thalassobacillus sp. CUG 92003]
MDWSMLVIIFSAGLGAGFINVMAGGGSLLTLPILIFAGLPSAMANGTNRIAILAQNITAILSFRTKGVFFGKLGFLLAIPAILGSIIGSNLAISINDALFNRLLSIIMIIVLIIIVVQPHKKIKPVVNQLNMLHKLGFALAFFLVGIYGGFIQAGIGFVIIAVLSLITSYNLIEINSLKVLIVGLYIACSLFVFILNDQIAWGYGVALALGMSLGAYIGSMAAIKKGEGLIKAVMVIAIIGMSISLWFRS